jgi:hypothetical protein
VNFSTVSGILMRTGESFIITQTDHARVRVTVGLQGEDGEYACRTERLPNGVHRTPHPIEPMRHMRGGWR